MLDLLRKRGVTPIEALGTDFDPRIHQAVSQETSDDAPRRRGDGGDAARLHAGRPAAARGHGQGRQSREQARLLRGPRGRARPRRTRKSRARTASWRSSTTRIAIPATRSGGTLQGGGRSLRGARRHRQAPHVRPLRPRRPGRRRHGRLRSQRLHRVRGHPRRPRRHLRSRRHLRRQAAAAAGPQRGADLRYDLEISFEESAKGAEIALQIPRQEQCETCRGSGAAAGSKPTTCPQCQGRGQLRYQQGFFTVARTCGQCRGTGTIIAKPCLTCKGAGPRPEGAQAHRAHSAPASPPDSGCASRGEGEAGPAGGPAGDLYVVIHVQEHPFFQREGNDLYCEVLVYYPTLALGGEIRCRRSTATSRSRPRGHAERADLPLARQRHARRVGPRAWRPAGDGQGGHAEEADESERRSCSRSWPRRCRPRQSSRRRPGTRTTRASSIA